MSVVTFSAESPVGVLADGTPYYAPIGEVIMDGSLVTCHLCGRALRSVTAHLRAHGWTKPAYCEAFGLERGQSLEAPETRKLRAVAMASRLVFDPAMRQGSAAGRARARTGALARDAARAATGRSLPEQRRRKAAAALSAIPPPLVARANRDRAARHLAGVAVEVARQQGYADLGAFVLARIEEGASLAVISREAGLNKDWLSRHLGHVDPAAADAARRRGPQRPDTRWLPALHRLGFSDVPSYLHERHIVQHWTVNAIAGEAGLAHHTVKAALRRHGVAQVAHAARRHAASQRAAQVAGSLGFDTMAGYVADRRGAGWTWAAMAAECAQPSSWLRRQARPDSRQRPQEMMPNDLRAATWPPRDPPPVARLPLRGQPEL
jgi:lambda repressor-like predicted transcriptional regulator